MLPQEIVDLVIDHLQTSASALHSCSLVSRRWTARSQKHLFARVVIRSDSLRRWCRNIIPGPTGVSSYTSHLALVASANPSEEEACPGPNLLMHASDHLGSFTNVHALDVVRWEFQDEELYTVPFKQIALSTRTLTVITPVLHSSTFLAFITLFERAKSVYIIHPHIPTEESVILDLFPTSSAVICWQSLHLLDFADSSLPLLKWIAQLPLRLTNLSVGLRSPSYHDSLLTTLLRAGSETLQTIQLCRSAGGKAI